MRKFLSISKILILALTFTLVLSGCIEQIPAPTADQSLTSALTLSNFYNYSSDLTVTKVSGIGTVSDINGTNIEISHYNFAISSDIVKFENPDEDGFCAFFTRNEIYEDSWDYFYYNYPSSTNSQALGYNFTSDNTDELEALSNLCGRFDIRNLIRDYFKHQGDGIYKIEDEVKANLNTKVFNTLPTYGLDDFTIQVVDKKISNMQAVYKKIGTSEYITYDAVYTYDEIIDPPTAFINSVVASDTLLQFGINDAALNEKNAGMRKIMLFSGTLLPNDSECLSVIEDGTNALTVRQINLTSPLDSGVYTIGVWVMGEGGAIDYYQTTFSIL